MACASPTLLFNILSITLTNLLLFVPSASTITNNLFFCCIIYYYVVVVESYFFYYVYPFLPSSACSSRAKHGMTPAKSSLSAITPSAAQTPSCLQSIA